MVFGDGTLTACKPIADEDLADFQVDCVEDPQGHRGVLPVGGPGPAVTPREQAQLLEGLLGRPVALKRVPVAVLEAAIAVLGTAGRFSATLADKAEFARIGRYYATESMLVWDERAQRYDEQLTPSYGTRTLRDHYARLLRGEMQAGLGEHAVF
jgi:divinyl chlorophyllide a 8-vinyl-reductase